MLLIMDLCLYYLIFIKIAHVPAGDFHWAQKVTKLGLIGAEWAGTC